MVNGFSFDVVYECELPPDVRTELVQPRTGRPPISPPSPPPRRAQILKEAPPIDPAAKGRLIVMVIPGVAMLGALIAAWANHKPPQSPAVRAVVESAAKKTLAQLQATPTRTPGPTVSRQGTAPEQLFRYRPAPRAVLVKLPPPRAQLVRVPEWRVGETAVRHDHNREWRRGAYR